MTESPRRTLVSDLLSCAFGFSQRGEPEDEEDESKDAHGYIEDDVHIRDSLANEALSDECADEHRCERGGEGVECAADHVQLVTAVTATSEEVEHRVNDGVEHTYTEAAEECAEEIDSETAHGTADPLYRHADETECDSSQGRFLVAELS